MEAFISLVTEFSREWTMDIVATDVLLTFNFAVVFNLNASSLPPSKAQFLGDVTMNRRNAANTFARVLNYVCFLYKEGR